jgi:hypothetical protein
VYEPFLIQQGFIMRTSRGREATELAYKHMNLPISKEIQDNLMGRGCPPISEYDPDLQLVWFIPREVKVKKTKNGAEYWIIHTTDT